MILNENSWHAKYYRAIYEETQPNCPSIKWISDEKH